MFRCHYRIIPILTIFLSSTLLAQAPDTLWTKTIGYAGHDYFTSVEQTTDGGFILGGVTSSFFNDSSAYWLVRLDSDYDTVWAKVFRAEKYDDQRAIQTTDGGFAIAGDGDPWLIKTDSSGNKLWDQATSTLGDNISIHWVEETADSGFIATGTDESSDKRKALVVKTDNTGAVVWTNSYGGEHDAAGLSVTETSDGGFAVAGAKQHPTGGDISHGWLLKLSVTGDSLWSTVHGDTADAMFKGLQETADSGFILIGNLTLPSDSTSDIYLVKTDSMGVTEWRLSTNGIPPKRSLILGGPGKDEGQSVIQTSDLGFTLTGVGVADTATGNVDAWVTHTNADCDSLWTLFVGGIGLEAGFDLTEISAGEYLVVGGTIDDWETGQFEGWLARLGTEGVAVAEQPVIPVELALHTNYPNPFNPSTTIGFDLPAAAEVTLTVYDILGREVRRLVNRQIGPGYHQAIWNGRTNDGREVPTGIYIARLETPAHSKSIKMLLLK